MQTKTIITYENSSLNRALSRVGALREVMTRAGSLLLALLLLETEGEIAELRHKGRSLARSRFKPVSIEQVAFLLARGFGTTDLATPYPTPGAAHAGCALIPRAWLDDARIADFHGWDTSYEAAKEIFASMTISA